MTSINNDLIIAYKNTRNLITQNPENKEKIINEYIDLVDKIYNYNQTPINTTNDNNSELGKMFKNPLEISIYNNFQRYNDDNIINPIIKKPVIDNKTARENSMKQLIKFKDYVK
jgi:hypothetical protein